MTQDKRDKPWIFRTYAGHSSAALSNALYKTNLEKGQAGLSVAFDLPTQTGYDSDHRLAKGEVGRVGVPICHLGDMRTLFADIPLDCMNTSMTINATAPWLLALYIALAKEQNIDPTRLRGTVQNDIIKEYLSRGTYIFGPKPSLTLVADVAEYCHQHVPNWNPMNVCSYHLQEAGATPEQELAYALATGIAVLDSLSNRVTKDELGPIVGRMSFFVNAGIRFVTELCKMRAFAELWDDLCKTRYGVEEERYRRFRYGVQVNSLGLTEEQPENNVYRILLEMLAVTLSKKARARAVQLPAWNEALGLPRPWDQQWSLRMQQILAYETDLLEFGDLFDGNSEIYNKVNELKENTLSELDQVSHLGGAVKAIEYMKSRLVESNAERLHKIETGETVVIGVNKYTKSHPSPLALGTSAALFVNESAEREQIINLHNWRGERNERKVSETLETLQSAARLGQNIMPSSIEAAQVGITTGEWANALREVFGTYRSPTGISTAPSNRTEGLEELRSAVDDISTKIGERLKLLIGKPGLDGHSNGAEQIVYRARDCGIQICYAGIRSTPEEIVAAVIDENVHIIGLSILSGSHLQAVSEIMKLLHEQGLANIPVIVGGIIPECDQEHLLESGVAAIFTPKDYDINQIMWEIINIAKTRKKLTRSTTEPIEVVA